MLSPKGSQSHSPGPARCGERVWRTAGGGEGRGCPARALLCRPLQALGTIYELLYIREYKAIVHWAFAGILLGLLTQLHYLFELGVVESIPEPQEDVLDMKPLGPCR